MIKLIKNYLRWPAVAAYYYLFRLRYRQMKILKEDEMFMNIIDNKVSISRFGDGEFKWILGVRQESFQQNDKELSLRLEQILSHGSDKDLLVCIPEIFKRDSQWTSDTKKFWRLFFYHYQRRISSYLTLNSTYGNSTITRCYIEYKDKKNALKRFDQFKKIWSQKDVVVIEGDQTCFGAGNNLLSNARSVQRIICPSTNAFSCYDEILRESLKIETNRLIIIALGPTASVLAYDLSRYGYQALDIGHIDIEYEWYLCAAEKKVSVRGKYVNESDNHLLSAHLDNEQYSTQIIKRIHPK